MKLERSQSAEEKARYKVVRTDDFSDVEGKIIAADESTGECISEFGGETKSFAFGAGGIRIVLSGRR